MSLQAILRSFPCRLGLRPHDWQFLSRLQDGPDRMIVERCSRQPLCRAVRWFPFQAIVPDQLVSVLIGNLQAANPYRALLPGTADMAPPVPEDTPEGSTPPSVVTFSDIVEIVHASARRDGASS